MPAARVPVVTDNVPELMLLQLGELQARLTALGDDANKIAPRLFWTVSVFARFASANSFDKVVKARRASENENETVNTPGVVMVNVVALVLRPSLVPTANQARAYW